MLLEVGYLDEVPPASLEALVRYTAARVLQHFLQGQSDSSSLWRHPVVINALEVAELLKIIDATDGLKPEVTAGEELQIMQSGIRSLQLHVQPGARPSETLTAATLSS